MGIAAGLRTELWFAAQGTHRDRFSDRRRFSLHARDRPVVVVVSVVEAAPLDRDPSDAVRGWTLACARHTAQSPVFCVHNAQRAGRVSRLLLVLLHQRTSAALPQPSLSARLQHSAATAVLAAESGVAVPVVCLSARCSEAGIWMLDARGAHAPDGSLLDRRRYALLHLFDDAGILFHADLSSARPAAGISACGGEVLQSG